MKLIDNRIIEYLEKKFGKENFDLEEYLNPQEKQLRDAKKFKNIDKIVDKIKKAIESNENILIYGDYDADGICASTILYLHLKSLGAKVDVYIPNRFDDGYGMSVDAIEYILEEYNPNMVITVDLGITAIEEVEILKQEGIEVIITDHHLPLEEIPDCLVVDPKCDNEEYGFEGLCGAGVAYKLVEALSGRKEANKYLDIAAIATVGDIVPLIDENRVIAKLGIDKINSGDCLESIKFLKEKLGIEKLTSTDISFKVVPRLNSCGRMDNALKAFNFLIQTNKNDLEKAYSEIEEDNNLRLSTIESGNKIIDEIMSSYDYSEPSILICGDFHEGTVGIIASKLCHDYNKPTIIFAKTENGTLKGSGRSIETIDIHKIISSMADNLINFGGHKMAVGLEIEQDYFKEFKRIFNQNISDNSNENDFQIKKLEPDILLTEDDLNLNFAKQYELLEPFGEGNEKPRLAIIQESMNVQPFNDVVFKHYKCFTSKNNLVLAFNFYKEHLICESPAKKYVFVDVNINLYRGKEQLSCYLKNIELLEPKFDENYQHDKAAAIYNKYYSTFDFNDYDRYFVVDNLEKIIREKFDESDYGTIVVASTNEDLKIINKLKLNKFICDRPYKNGQNVVLCTVRNELKTKDLYGYKNIIFLHKYFDEEHLFYSQRLSVYESSATDKLDALSSEREVFAKVYKLLSCFSGLKANDVLDFCEKLSIKDKTTTFSQIMFCICVFLELNFIEFDEQNCMMKILKSKKTEITKSKFLSEIIG